MAYLDDMFYVGRMVPVKWYTLRTGARTKRTALKRFKAKTLTNSSHKAYRLLDTKTGKVLA